MSMHINLDLKNNSSDIAIPISTTTPIELNFAPITQEITLLVSDFPSFVKVRPNASTGFIRDTVGVNILSQRLVVDADLLFVSDIDTMTIEELDICQNKIIYSI